jgi:hypothetical protein
MSACSKKKDPNTQYGAQPGYGQPGYQQPGQPGYQQPGQPGYQQPGQPGYQQPAPTGTQPAPAPTGAPAAGGACTPVDASMAAPAGQVLQLLAQNEVPPGAKPMGAIAAANCQAGQSHEAQIQMQPGKCYTIVAAGVGVSEVDLQLVAVTPIPNVAPVLGQDSTTGPQAVIGKRPDCYKWAWPMGGAVKLVIKATAGSGLVGAQVYEK